MKFSTVQVANTPTPVYAEYADSRKTPLLLQPGGSLGPSRYLGPLANPSVAASAPKASNTMLSPSMATSFGLSRKAPTTVAVTAIAAEENVIMCLKESWYILASSSSRPLSGGRPLPPVGGSATEPPPPPGPLYALLGAWGIRPGLCPLRLLLDRLGRFSLVWRGFYGRYPRSEGGDDPAVLTVRFLQGAHPIAQLV